MRPRALAPGLPHGGQKAGCALACAACLRGRPGAAACAPCCGARPRLGKKWPTPGFPGVGDDPKATITFVSLDFDFLLGAVGLACPLAWRGSTAPVWLPPATLSSHGRPLVEGPYVSIVGSRDPGNQARQASPSDRGRAANPGQKIQTAWPRCPRNRAAHKRLRRARVAVQILPLRRLRAPLGAPRGRQGRPESAARAWLASPKSR